MILIFVIIAVSYIAVGVPDSVLGSLWPAIYSELNLPVSLAGYISMAVSASTAVSCLFSASLIKKFGTATVTFFSSFITAIALLLLSTTKNVGFFFLFSIPLGVGAGTVDAALNSFVALYCSASQMSFLHCFYGLGVSASPYILSSVLFADNSWRKGYLVVGLIQLFISLFILICCPYWKRKEKQTENNEEDYIKILSVKQMLKIPSVVASLIMFFFVCAAEYTAGSWSATYFAEYKGASPDEAAAMAMFYYVGITAGRFVSGIAGRKLESKSVLNLSFLIMLISLPVLAAEESFVFSVVGLFLFGFGMGPAFPNLSFIVPELFGRAISRSIIGIQLASTYIGIMVMPTIYGIIAEKIDAGLFPVVLLVLISIYFISHIIMKKLLKTKQIQ